MQVLYVKTVRMEIAAAFKGETILINGFKVDLDYGNLRR